MKNEVSQIRARKESLEQVLAHRTYTTESVKRLFASLEKGKADDLKPLGVLADYVEVDPQFEKPAEEFLHEELEYVVVQNWQQAERGLDFIRAELDGRATFLVHPGAERPYARPPARARHRPRDRHHRAPQRFAAPHQRLQGSRDRPDAARLACASWRRIAPPRSAWRSAIRTSISCCPTASAITATPSPAARRPAPARWP